MGLILPGGENLLDFLELRQVLSTYDGYLTDPLWWPQERPVPMRVARGPLRIPLPSMPGPETAGSQCEKAARDKVMRKEAAIRKACSDFRDPSGNF